MILLIVVPFVCVGIYAAIFSKILPYKSLLFPIVPCLGSLLPKVIHIFSKQK